MKRYQSGAAKQRKTKKDQEVESQRNALHKFLVPESLPKISCDTEIPFDNNQTLSNVKGDSKDINENALQLRETVEKGTNAPTISITYSDMCVQEISSVSTTEAVNDLGTYTVIDKAFWPSNFGDEFIEHVVRNKLKNIGDITTSRTL